MISKLRQAAQTEVDNHSIYVWGGSGQLCCEVSEAWIRQKEKGRMPNEAVKAWEEVESGPYRDVARLFDCSGFVSWCLVKAGAFKGRTDCDGLFARCEEIYTPTDGTLLFRVNPSKPSDETHVGLYFDGKQYHAKGRAYGVVCEPFKASYWQKYGWFKALKPDPAPDPDPGPDPDPKGVVEVVARSVNVRTSDSTKGKILLTAHNAAWYKAKGVKHENDRFPFVEVAPSGWYEIETSKGLGYITNKARYTKLWTE